MNHSEIIFTCHSLIVSWIIENLAESGSGSNNISDIEEFTRKCLIPENFKFGFGGYKGEI